MTVSWSQEWRLFLGARANIVLLLVLLLLSSLGAWNGAQRLAASDSAAAEAVEADREAYAAKRAKLADFEAGKVEASAAAGVRFAHKAVLGQAHARPLVPPRAELGALSAAERRPAPDLLNVGIQTRHKDQMPTLDDPTNRLDGPFDLSFVATWLVPLFALLLGYDVLARDREQGIAALLAAQGRSLGRIAAMRLTIRFISLFAVVAGVALLATLWSEASHLGAALPGFVAWSVGLALSIGFWLALAAGVNGTARSTASASLALLGAWVASALLAPAVIGAALAFVAPPPDRLQGVLDLRELETDLTRRRAEVTAAYYAAHPNNRPRIQGDEYERYFVGEFYPRVLAFDRAFAPIAARMDAVRVRQAQALRTASILSPSLALKLMTEDLAGGAPERRAAFLAAADDYQRQWRAHFDHKLASMTPMVTRDYAEAPVFAPSPEPPAARWGRLAWLLAMLALPFLLAMLWARRALGRAGPI